MQFGNAYIKLELKPGNRYYPPPGFFYSRVRFYGRIYVGIDIPDELAQRIREEARKKKKGYNVVAARMIKKEIIKAIRSFEATGDS